MFAIGTRSRLFAGLAGVFCTVLIFYFVIWWSFAPAATPATIAFTSCIVIYLVRRWHVEPTLYDTELSRIYALTNIMPLMNGGFLPFGIMALEPRSLSDLLGYIQRNRCKTIVECGSGVSTITIGNLLKLAGVGHLYSLEDDENWFRLISSTVANTGLAEYVTVIHAPLCRNVELGARWYSQDATCAFLTVIDRIDLLLIDGPISVDGLSRYPALPMFATHIDENTLIVLDDAKRNYEQSVLARWKQDFDLAVEMHDEYTKGQAYIRLRGQMSSK